MCELKVVLRRDSRRAMEKFLTCCAGAGRIGRWRPPRRHRCTDDAPPTVALWRTHRRPGARGCSLRGLNGVGRQRDSFLFLVFGMSDCDPQTSVGGLADSGVADNNSIDVLNVSSVMAGDSGGGEAPRRRAVTTPVAPVAWTDETPADRSDAVVKAQPLPSRSRTTAQVRRLCRCC